MLIAIGLILLSLIANIWLWGQWSLESFSGLRNLLLADTGVLLFLFLFPIYRLINGKKIKEISKSWLMKIMFLILIVLTAILCVASFYGLMAYLLPVKIVLLAIFVFLTAKQKKLFSKFKK